MPRQCDKIHLKARRAPASLTFRELCRLAECHGFELRRIGGSHRVYEHPHQRRPLVLQPHGKMARPYQVRQLLKAIEDIEEPNG